MTIHNKLWFLFHLLYGNSNQLDIRYDFQFFLTNCIEIIHHLNYVLVDHLHMDFYMLQHGQLNLLFNNLLFLTKKTCFTSFHTLNAGNKIIWIPFKSFIQEAFTFA